MPIRLNFQNPLRDVGPAWSQANAEFETTNPNFGRRLLRAANPLTGFGSALGSLHDGISNGDPAQAGMATLQAAPVFGALRAVPYAKTASGYLSNMVPQYAQTATRYGSGVGVGAGADAAYADPLEEQQQQQGLRNGSRVR